MSISMMYQFENNFFSLPAKFFDFSCFTNPHLWKYTKQRKSKFSLIKFKP